MPNEVFISHSNLDIDFTDSLIKILNRHGIPTWQSGTNILGAQQWHDEIGLALRRCDWFITIMSSNSIESKWVKRELLFALQQNHFENKIIPILAEPCDFDQLSWTLSIFQVVDFTNSFDVGAKQLLKIWGIGMK